MSETAEYLPFDGLPVPMLVVRDERILHVNPALLALLGVEPQDVLHAPLSRVFCLEAGHERPDEPQRVRVRVAGGQERTCRPCRGEGRCAGDTVWMLLDAEGEELGRRLTESLAEAAGELVHCRDERTVLESTVEAIHRQGFFVTVMVLTDGQLSYGPLRQPPELIATCERLYGQRLEDIRLPRATLPHFEEVWTRRRAALHPHLARLFEHVPSPEPLARLRHEASSARVLNAPLLVEGVPYGVLSVQGDALTPTSAATLELFARQVGGALENVRHHQRAQERLAELSRLQSELLAQERLTVLGEAAGVVAHEVRNPLGAILNAAAVLKRDTLGAVGRSAVEMLEEEATRLDGVVRDLLDVVRPLEPRPRPLHVGEFIRRTLEGLRQRRQLGTLRVGLSEAPGVPTLQGDEFLLQLALENLLRNAVQACPPDSQVTVSVEPSWEASGAPSGACVLVCVEDEGPGIAPADAARVFEPFFTTRATGTGLGLAVVRRVVQAHGGSVCVGPRPGGGARFELRFPGTQGSASVSS